MKLIICPRCGKPTILVTAKNEQITRELYNTLTLTNPNHEVCIECEG